MPNPVNLVGPNGDRVGVQPEALDQFLQEHPGYRPEGAQERLSTAKEQGLEEYYSQPSQQLLAAGERLVAGPTAGLSDVLLSLGDREGVARRKEELGGLGTALEVTSGLGTIVASGGAGAAGALARATPAGLAARAGAATAGRLGAVAGVATEAGLWGLGSGAAELALSQDPLTGERIASTLGSHVGLSVAGGVALHGLGTLAGKAWSKAVGRSKKLADDVGSKAVAAEQLGDLAGKSKPELRALEEVENLRIDAERAIEKQAVVGDLEKFREAYAEISPHLALEGIEGKGLGADAFRADKHIDRLLANREGLAANPARVVDDLQVARQAWKEWQVASPEIKKNLLKKDWDGWQALKQGYEGEVAAIDAIPDAAMRAKLLRGELEAFERRGIQAVDDALPATGPEPVIDPQATAALSKPKAAKAVEQLEKASLVSMAQEYRAAAKQIEEVFASHPELAIQAKNLSKAHKKLDDLLGDVNTLGKKPQLMLKAARRAEQALDESLPLLDNLYPAAPVPPAQGANFAARLDRLPELISASEALEARIAAATGPRKSPLLDQLQLARDFLDTPAVPKGFIRKTVENAFGVMGGGLGAKVGGGVGAAAGFGAGKAVGEKLAELVWGRAGRAVADSTERLSTALGKVTSGTKKAAKLSPVVTTRVLSQLRYGDEVPKPPKEPSGSKRVEAFRARERELRSQVQQDMMGNLLVTPAARMRIYDNLSGVRAASPVLADQLETMAVRKVEFLASKLPRRPDATALEMAGGGSRWQPSDFEIAKFARYALAVEDAPSVVERVTDGSITPEDAEAFRSVYPELFQQTVIDAIEKVAEAENPLPYKQRLGLSILTGMPLDPSLQPQVIARLQSNFHFEPGTEGGMQAPRAAPNFGSMPKNGPNTEPTPGQRRASGSEVA